MPLLTLLFIRTALIYFGMGFTIGSFILIAKGTYLFPMSWLFLPVHIELLLFGWTLQLAIGVAFWIFPRFPKKPYRGREQSAWLSYILLNVGIVISVVGYLKTSLSPLILWGHILEIVAVLFFVLYVWPRVKAFAK
ncbi:hypothetical protein IIC38_10165 [candidate division KSB1 bacterium]|nr:hypothetical protein [candidate division KSB1 bacterium]